MIRYALRCENQHGFEAWFRDSAAYDQQAARGILVCPVCSSAKVSKAPMAPAIAKTSRNSAAIETARAEAGASGALATETAQPTIAPAEVTPVPESLEPRAVLFHAMLVKLRQHVEANCDYVGNKFAEEARRIHYGEADERGIYGEATQDEAEALLEEGIEVGAVPWVRADS